MGSWGGGRWEAGPGPPPTPLRRLPPSPPQEDIERGYLFPPFSAIQAARRPMGPTPQDPQNPPVWGGGAEPHPLPVIWGGGATHHFLCRERGCFFLVAFSPSTSSPPNIEHIYFFLLCHEISLLVQIVVSPGKRQRHFPHAIPMKHYGASHFPPPSNPELNCLNFPPPPAAPGAVSAKLGAGVLQYMFDHGCAPPLASGWRCSAPLSTLATNHFFLKQIGHIAQATTRGGDPGHVPLKRGGGRAVPHRHPPASQVRAGASPRQRAGSRLGGPLPRPGVAGQGESEGWGEGGVLLPPSLLGPPSSLPVNASFPDVFRGL